jgi:ArsR family transcriptional regulator
LFKNESCHVKSLSNILEMTHSACSQHISKLKDQGLIVGKKDGKNVFYSISPESTKLVRKLISQFSKNLDS